ncbi:hypothetical protein BB560_006473 [Smittium megazygosporum]|uniref:SPX domain-containing protein n=1 Tax=Smittium megazygosporum TaxID=133381 RepID=A0A2T9Y5L2_9FUNG|nr:hypothetical protein BB560_006473 [Smittium megazygosporum]
MKFESVLQFNAVPEWADKYVAYHNLKKIIYSVEKKNVLGAEAQEQPEEGSPMIDQSQAARVLEFYEIPPSQSSTCARFLIALDRDIETVNNFYLEKEKQAIEQTEKLEADFKKYEEKFEKVIEMLDESTCSIPNLKTVEFIPDLNRSQSRSVILTSQNESSDSEVEQENRLLNKKAKSRNKISRSHLSSSNAVGRSSETEQSEYEDDEIENLLEVAFKIKMRQASMRKKILSNKARELFILVSDLQTFSKLNSTGFNKILKKFEKVNKISIKNTYTTKTLNNSYAFSSEAHIRSNTLLSRIVSLFSTINAYPSEKEAIEDLKTSLRDQVYWDRNTVWRDLISMERKVGAVEVLSMQKTTELIKPTSSWSKESIQLLYFALCLSAFTFCLIYSPFTDLVQQRCWALLVFVSSLWATEAIPLHVTAMFVPLLVVVLQVLKDPSSSKVMPASDSAKFIFSSMFTSVIMLLLGGFTLAAALSKHNIAKVAASFVLSKVNNSPESILLANMFVATFASMWISNVAAPVLCFSLIQPILRTLPDDHPLGPCLVIGIALASNVGGMASPIASPQNIIAIGIMDPAPSWLQWFLVSIPTCTVINIGVWGFLLLVYKPSQHPVNLNRTRFIPEKLTSTQWYVIAVSGVTIVLWCLSTSLSHLFGDMGVLAILPIVFLFGSTSVLSKEDFNNFLWTVVVLAMGGTALGKAVQSSGLLDEISKIIAGMIGDLSPYMVLAAFCGLILVVCTFVSHTVGAMIILPIVYEVGYRIPGNYSRILVMASALMASGAMGLPVSGFPNMNAIMLEDAKGKPYLTVRDFFVAGVPSSVVAYFVIITIGYFFMYISGF